MLECRHQKDFPELMDSQQEEAREKQRFEKIQKYRLTREKVVESYKQQMSEQNELMKHHLEVYKNMQVSKTDTGEVCNCLKKKKKFAASFTG